MEEIQNRDPQQQQAQDPRHEQSHGEATPEGGASGTRPPGKRRRRSRRGRGRGGAPGETREGGEKPAIREVSAIREISAVREVPATREPSRAPRGEPRGEPRPPREPREHRRRDRHEPEGERRPSVPRGLTLDPEMPSPDREQEIPLDRLDRDAVKVIARLRSVGHKAYFVGGCVRDALLGRTPKDFDLATDAHPGEVRAIFRNCRLIGRRFRLAHVFFRDGKIIEVATFRQNPVDVGDDVPSDADLLITRDNVFGTAEEDARRRDFTVNGLFYDPFLGEVIDYVGGRADLDARRMSTIGDPEVRMREDPVRALRAIRFAARLGFTIEPEVFEAMRRHAGELARCAPPRVLEETFKILRCTGSSRAFELLRSAGLLQVTLPALSQALDAGGIEARTRFQAHLSALDGLVREGDEVSDAVLLGALLVHLRAGPAGEPAADLLLAELVQTARLPRRMAERARMALQAQRLFRGPPRRRRRGGLAGQAYFQDALQLLRVTVKATGEGAEALARWEDEGQGGRGEGAEEIEPSMLAEAESDDAAGPATTAGASARTGDAPAGPEDVGPDGAHRRRRGGRRRRRRGKGAGGAPQAAPSAPPAGP
ncbi:MAG: polynucleotide adenylyltransferase PcnB [Deltaproteobacteria bacterium]